MPTNESHSNQGPAPRLIGLDLLRCLAISVVLIDHSHNFGNAGKLYAATPGAIGSILSLISGMGWVSVHVFFVLSGFLVSGLLFQEAAKTGTIRISRFLIRRGFKIYPAFWVMTAATLVISWLHGGHVPWKCILGELFYLQNYGWAMSFHTWSLAAEEHFYFLLAGIFYLAIRLKNSQSKPQFGWVPYLCLGMAVLCLFLRGVVWYCVPVLPGYNDYLFRFADDTTLDSLFFGVFLAHFWHNRWSGRIKRGVMFLSIPLGVVGVLMVLPFWTTVMDYQWYLIFGYILLYLGSGCLLLSSMALDYFRCPRPVRWLASLGKYSYSVYLWHLLVGYYLFPWVNLKSDTPFARIYDASMYFCLAWIVGIILALLIEIPVLRCRDRWFPSLSR